MKIKYLLLLGFFLCTFHSCTVDYAEELKTYGYSLSKEDFELSFKKYIRSREKFDAVKLYLDYGMNADSMEMDSSDFLFFPVHYNKLELVKYYFEKGHLSIGDLEGSSNLQRNLLNVATRGRHALCFYNENNQPIYSDLQIEGVEDGESVGIALYAPDFQPNVDMIKYLIEKGVDINHKTTEGETPLYSATFANNLIIVNELLKNGASPNSYTDLDDDKGGTPLMVAAYYGNLEMIKVLINHGADIDASRKTNKDVTPVIFAYSNDHEKATDLLVEYGAKDPRQKKQNRSSSSNTKRYDPCDDFSYDEVYRCCEAEYYGGTETTIKIKCNSGSERTIYQYENPGAYSSVEITYSYDGSKYKSLYKAAKAACGCY